MAANCYDTDLLKYSGTSQVQRILVALLNDYVKVDERKPADLILFEKKYGAYLNYFDATNSINGNWQNFMSKDAAVIIAAISDLKIKDFTSFIENINKETSDASSDIDAEKYFKTIFDKLFIPRSRSPFQNIMTAIPLIIKNSMTYMLHVNPYLVRTARL